MSSRPGKLGLLALRGDELVTEWSTVDQGTLPELQNGWLSPGRSRSTTGESFFLRSSSSLVEIWGPGTGLPPRRLDVDGTIPYRSLNGEGWRLSPNDCLHSVDLDGDGTDEIFVKGFRRVGLIREFPDGLFLVWFATNRIGMWPIGPDVSGIDALVYVGDFLDGPGEELVLANGTSWLALGWDPVRSRVERIALANGYIPDPTKRHRPWPLHRGQRIVTGSFLPEEPTLLLVHDGAGLLAARLTRDGFQEAARFPGRVGAWSLSEQDRFIPVQADDDPQEELSVKRGALMGILELAPPARASFIGEYEPSSATFRSPRLFLRGDVNQDDDVDLSDALTVLAHLFLGGSPVDCEDAADTDDSGELDLSDAIRLLNYLFNGSQPPPPPGPVEAGTDPTPDELSCEAG